MAIKFAAKDPDPKPVAAKTNPAPAPVVLDGGESVDTTPGTDLFESKAGDQKRKKKKF